MPTNKTKEKAMTELQLNYMVTASHSGLDGDLDAKIEKKAGRMPLGTGYACWVNRRDVDFGFARKDAAVKAAARIRRLRNVRACVRKVTD